MTPRARTMIAIATVALAACGNGKGRTMHPSTQPSPLAADAVAGATDAKLRAVLADHWEHWMRWSPTFATTLGDHRYDDRLAPRDAAAIERARAERDALRARLVGLEPASETDRVTTSLLRERLEAERAMDACHFHEWVVETGGGSLFGELSFLVEQHVVKTASDAANLVARMDMADRLVDDTIANLGRGLAAGRVSSKEKVKRALAQLDTELGKASDTWAMANPAWVAHEGADRSPTQSGWPAGERAKLAAQLRAIVEKKLHPAFERQRAFLRDKVMPAARGELEGLSGLADGDACYRAAILFHVGQPRTPEELHALGRAEIAKSDREIAELGKKLFGTADLAATLHVLRTDPKLYFTSREEILEASQKALDRSKAAMAGYFSVLPKADCVMREIPSYEAPFTTIAYYRQPNYDGSKPGEYFVNTYKPEVRPRFELEALSWHEAIPGHHLQIAIAQELGALPAFRKLDGSTAYIEGWALYTERLAEEMGLYSSDLDRIGKLSYDAWRGSRLVVDTGLHAMGWTRAQAEAYMREHTALTETNISNEVDRYIGWPGQALAYKVGQLEILKLRAEAEAALGSAFDLKAFHRVVLGSGAVTLPVLADLVHAWVRDVKK